MEPLQPYDILIQADPERLKDYNQLCGLYSNWEDEERYLNGIFSESKAEDEEEMILFSLRSVLTKRGAITTAYVNKYSEYKFHEVVQLIKNNRVVGIGEIEHIEVARCADQIHNFSKSMKPPFSVSATPIFSTVRNEFYPYSQYEFMYYINHRENKRILKTMAYRVESPLRIMHKPTRMMNKCPVCQTEDKPQVDCVIGGEPKVICCDCDNIIRDIFGDTFTKQSLSYDDIMKAPHHDIILNYSTTR